MSVLDPILKLRAESPQNYDPYVLDRLLSKLAAFFEIYERLPAASAAALRQLQEAIAAELQAMTGKTVDEVMAEPAPTFVQELRSLINRHSLENDSGTPDFILADYLNDQLAIFGGVMRQREQYYGRAPVSAKPPTELKQEGEA